MKELRISPDAYCKDKEEWRVQLGLLSRCRRAAESIQLSFQQCLLEGKQLVVRIKFVAQLQEQLVQAQFLLSWKSSH